MVHIFHLSTVKHPNRILYIYCCLHLLIHTTAKVVKKQNKTGGRGEKWTKHCMHIWINGKKKKPQKTQTRLCDYIIPLPKNFGIFSLCFVWMIFELFTRTNSNCSFLSPCSSSCSSLLTRPHSAWSSSRPAFLQLLIFVLANPLSVFSHISA
jgi:hypothetical protein